MLNATELNRRKRLEIDVALKAMWERTSVADSAGRHQIFRNQISAGKKVDPKGRASVGIGRWLGGVVGEEFEKATLKIGPSTAYQVGVYRMLLYGRGDVDSVDPTVGNDL